MFAKRKQGQKFTLQANKVLIVIAESGGALIYGPSGSAGAPVFCNDTGILILDTVSAGEYVVYYGTIYWDEVDPDQLALYVDLTDVETKLDTLDTSVGAVDTNVQAVDTNVQAVDANVIVLQNLVEYLLPSIQIHVAAGTPVTIDEGFVVLPLLDAGRFWIFHGAAGPCNYMSITHPVYCTAGDTIDVSAGIGYAFYRPVP